jgi:hypothetical protein
MILQDCFFKSRETASTTVTHIHRVYMSPDARTLSSDEHRRQQNSNAQRKYRQKMEILEGELERRLEYLGSTEEELKKRLQNEPDDQDHEKDFEFGPETQSKPMETHTPLQKHYPPQQDDDYGFEIGDFPISEAENDLASLGLPSGSDQMQSTRRPPVITRAQSESRITQSLEACHGGGGQMNQFCPATLRSQMIPENRTLPIVSNYEPAGQNFHQTSSYFPAPHTYNHWQHLSMGVLPVVVVLPLTFSSTSGYNPQHIMPNPDPQLLSVPSYEPYCQF